MIELVTILLEIITFFLIHHKFSFIDKYPYGWRENSNRVVGVMFTLPFFAMFFVASRDRPLARAIKSYLLAFLGSGLGTAAGWASDAIL